MAKPTLGKIEPILPSQPRTTPGIVIPLVRPLTPRAFKPEASPAGAARVIEELLVQWAALRTHTPHPPAFRPDYTLVAMFEPDLPGEYCTPARADQLTDAE